MTFDFQITAMIDMDKLKSPDHVPSEVFGLLEGEASAILKKVNKDFEADKREHEAKGDMNGSFNALETFIRHFDDGTFKPQDIVLYCYMGYTMPFIIDQVREETKEELIREAVFNMITKSKVKE